MPNNKFFPLTFSCHHVPQSPCHNLYIISKTTKGNNMKELIEQSYPKSYGQSTNEFLSNRPWLMSRKTRADNSKKSIISVSTLLKEVKVGSHPKSVGQRLRECFVIYEAEQRRLRFEKNKVREIGQSVFLDLLCPNRYNKAGSEDDLDFGVFSLVQFLWTSKEMNRKTYFHSTNLTSSLRNHSCLFYLFSCLL